MTRAIVLAACWATGATCVAQVEPSGKERPSIERPDIKRDDVATHNVTLPDARPVHRVQVVPLPAAQIAVTVDGRELTRYHFAASQRRPFLYPIVGPAGRSLTRLGNIRDPHGHRHHYSVWTAHHDVDGVNFWTDDSPAQIVHRRASEYVAGDDSAFIVIENDWIDGDGDGDGAVLINERRRLEFVPREDHQWLLIVELTLRPTAAQVTLGKTPFGLMGVRVATSLSVQDGGGMIRNSEGGTNEAEVMAKRARWVDYSGPITNGAAEGLTLMDHPDNPRHPCRFHVRDDGWMGASLTFAEPYVIERGEPLHLTYGLYIHAGVPTHEALDAEYRRFVEKVGH